MTSPASAPACLAGGVALNCVANARAARDGTLRRDLGPARRRRRRRVPSAPRCGPAPAAATSRGRGDRGRVDGMSGAAPRPGFAHEEIAAWLDRNGIALHASSPTRRARRAVAAALDDGQIVGWFQGRMEFGPRAAGPPIDPGRPRGRPTGAPHQPLVKGREGFRPFAPAVLAEHAADWFELDRRPALHDRHRARRGDGPGVGRCRRRLTGRADGVRRSPGRRPFRDPGVHPRRRLGPGPDRRRRPSPPSTACSAPSTRRTGCPVLLNTSFNRKDEPIVCTPADALRCFVTAGLDVLVIERCLVTRADLPPDVVAA